MSPPTTLLLSAGLFFWLSAAPAESSRAVLLVALGAALSLQLLGHAISLAYSRVLPLSPARDMYVVVTGASSGIGKACAFELVRRGFNVLLVARRAALLKEVQAALLSEGGGGVLVSVLPLDLADATLDAGEAVLRALAERGAYCGALVSAAGASDRREFVECSREEHRWAARLNYTSHVELIRTLAPPMCARRQGRVLVIGSIVGSAGQPFNAAYSASKAALSNLCDAVHYELALKGVGVTCALPGATDTGFAQAGGSEDGLIFKLPTTSAAQVAERAVLAMLRAERQVVIGRVSTFFYLCGLYCPAPVSLVAGALFWNSPSGALTHFRSFLRDK